jgi:hypothetical protein
MRIGSVLEQSLKRLNLGMQLDEYGVWPIWNDVVGKAVANNAQPERIRNGTLFLKVSSPVWMQQLQYMKELIAEKLNDRLGAGLVKNIFFVVGKIEPITEEGAPATQVEEKPLPPLEIDTSFLETVADPEIRQAFERILKSYAKRRAQRD